MMLYGSQPTYSEILCIVLALFKPDILNFFLFRAAFTEEGGGGEGGHCPFLQPENSRVFCFSKKLMGIGEEG